jgi:hypothetical protein
VLDAAKKVAEAKIKDPERQAVFLKLTRESLPRLIAGLPAELDASIFIVTHMMPTARSLSSLRGHFVSFGRL